jgi:pimeloyl-ACP methyl ester carboxylesterase
MSRYTHIPSCLTLNGPAPSPGRPTAAPLCPPDLGGLASTTSRREHLALLGAAPLLISRHASSATVPTDMPSSVETKQPQPVPNYTQPGPCLPFRLPQLEHTCTVCAASADRCRLKIQAWVPKGATRHGLGPPYPLAILTAGFLISSEQYISLAEHLASWGYLVILYDGNQQALDPISDVVCVAFLRDLIDWARTTAPLSNLADLERVYLIGHSRGGKISVLAAVQDPRVRSVFLIDPVDVTVYAPLSAEYPSAAAALRKFSKRVDVDQGMKKPLPLAVVGSGRGGDCVPLDSNYATFYDAASGPAWQAVIQDAGHLQFLDTRNKSSLDLFCVAGKVPDAIVRQAMKAMCVAWGEVTVRGRREDAGMVQGVGSTAASEAPSDTSEGDGTPALFGGFRALSATEEDIRRAARNAGRTDFELSLRTKNFG